MFPLDTLGTLTEAYYTYTYSKYLCVIPLMYVVIYTPLGYMQAMFTWHGVAEAAV